MSDDEVEAVGENVVDSENVVDGGGDDVGAGGMEGDPVSAGSETNGDGNGDGGDGAAGNTTVAGVAAAPKGVTLDDQTRYLVEIVANAGLSKAAAAIAEQIGSKQGILIVDDLAFAANDITYMDIKNKLADFQTLVNNEQTKCETLRQEIAGDAKVARASTERIDAVAELLNRLQKDPDFIREVSGTPRVFSAASLIGAAGSVQAVATAVSGSLKAIADVISYFRADYTIKGQDIDNIDALYIKALVSRYLVAKGAGVHLLNFNFVRNSDLLKGLSDLLQKHLALLACLEQIDPQAMEAPVEALQTYMDSLRAKYAEAILQVDDQALKDLATEIDKSRARIAVYQQNRYSDTHVTALEAHLSALQAKLVEAVALDAGASEAAVRKEIAAATAALEKPDLTQAKKDEFTAHRKNMQAELAKIVVLKNSKTVTNLKQSIAVVEGDLARIRKDRVPQARISAEEQHLAELLSKQAELLAANDNDAADALRSELARTESRLNEMQRIFYNAQRRLNSGKKIADAVNAFVENISAVPEGETLSPLISACLREYVAAAEQGINYLLKLKLISAGGEVITDKNWGFWSRPDLSYLGGGLISYVLAEKSGKVVAADTLYGISKLEHKIGSSPKTLIYNIE